VQPKGIRETARGELTNSNNEIPPIRFKYRSKVAGGWASWVQEKERQEEEERVMEQERLLAEDSRWEEEWSRLEHIRVKEKPRGAHDKGNRRLPASIIEFTRARHQRHSYK
jgi:hypothetical protein